MADHGIVDWPCHGFVVEPKCTITGHLLVNTSASFSMSKRRFCSR